MVSFFEAVSQRQLSGYLYRMQPTGDKLHQKAYTHIANKYCILLKKETLHNS